MRLRAITELDGQCFVSTFDRAPCDVIRRSRPNGPRKDAVRLQHPPLRSHEHGKNNNCTKRQKEIERESEKAKQQLGRACVHAPCSFLWTLDTHTYPRVTRLTRAGQRLCTGSVFSVIFFVSPLVSHYLFETLSASLLIFFLF